MLAAIEQAREGGEAGEVPIGAVVVLGGAVIGRGSNRTIRDRDPSAHAEIVALRAAALAAGNHRLEGATLTTTLEPCLMCCGALVQARVRRLVWGADDPKAGALGALRAETDAGRVNHRVELDRGPLAEECAALLRTFFQARR